MPDPYSWGKKSNPVIFRTISVIFRTNPVIFRMNAVRSWQLGTEILTEMDRN